MEGIWCERCERYVKVKRNKKGQFYCEYCHRCLHDKVVDGLHQCACCNELRSDTMRCKVKPAYWKEYGKTVTLCEPCQDHREEIL